MRGLPLRRVTTVTVVTLRNGEASRVSNHAADR